MGAHNATVACPFVKMGLVPDMGALWSLPRKIGHGAARRIFTLGEAIDGTEAGRLGLFDEVVAPGQALAKALEVAGRYAALPGTAVALQRAVLAKGIDTLEDAIRSELDMQPVLLDTDDHREAVAAFLQKRKPVFAGH